MSWVHILFRRLHELFPWLAGLALLAGWLAALVVLTLLIFPTSEATGILRQLFTNETPAAVEQSGPSPSPAAESPGPSLTPSPEDTIITGLGGEETPPLQSPGAQTPPEQGPAGQVPPIQGAPNNRPAPHPSGNAPAQPQPAPVSPPLPNNASLRVKVIADQVCSGPSPTSTEPNPGATVNVGPSAVTTGADGVGRTSIPAGTYTISGEGQVRAIHVNVTGRHDPGTTSDVQSPTLSYTFDAQYANGPGLSDYEVAVTFQSLSC